jgi:PAS domain S-box-containing protein
VRANAAASRVLERDELVGTPLLLGVAPIHVPPLRAQLDLALQTRRQVSVSARLFEGERARWVHFEAAPGAGRSLIVALHDVTEVQRTQDSLRMSEARFRALFEGSFDAYALLDGATLLVEEVNPSFVRLTAIEPEEIIGRRLRGLFPEAHRWPMSAALREAIHHGRAGPLALTLPRPGGEPRRVELMALGIRAAGALYLLVGLRDVHDSWMAVQRRRQVERQLWEVHQTELVGALAAHIAHDLNNVLMAAQGRIEALRAEGLAESSDFAEVLAAFGRARNLTHNLMGYAGVGGEGRAPVAWTEIAARVVGAVQTTRSGRQMAVAVPADLRSEVQASSMTQALINLVEMAMDARSGLVSIRARQVEVSPPWIEIEVEGEGTAPPGEDAPIDPVSGDTRTALAWSVARGAIDEHEGRLDQARGPGGSIRFLVRLRAAPDVDPAATAVVVTVQHLLVVDDDPLVLKAVTRMLTVAGYQVTSALGGVAGCRALQEGKFDAVLVDLTMPDIPGEEVLRLAAKTTARLVAMTGYTATELAEDLRGRVAAVLRKPFDVREVGRAFSGV